MADREQVRSVFYDKIVELLEQPTTAVNVLQLAEAFAWVSNPNQPHGGGAAPTQ
jgi:hypothetical protein